MKLNLHERLTEIMFNNKQIVAITGRPGEYLTIFYLPAEYEVLLYPYKKKIALVGNRVTKKQLYKAIIKN